MKKEVLGSVIILALAVIAGLFFLNNALQKENINGDDKIQIISPVQSLGLGSLCSDEEECISFCKGNRGRCEEYCNGSENELCMKIFPPENERNLESDVRQDERPVLKSLGVNIDAWNKQTNLAGDLLFSKKLLFDDGRISNDKVFIDFGHKEKYRPDDIGSIEYWFFVPLKTKVRAPVDGRTQVVFFNHTQDWGVNFMQEGSPWIVSFEHVVNVAVKDGNMIKAGDIVGEAAPRSTFNNEIAMVEFAVWNPGQQIAKYCPFLFLDNSLKPEYEQKINQLAKDWEEFIGIDVYKQEEWVAPGCLVERIVER